eukprot:1358852-Amorphochlora_amoeboformis.AAC.1
MCTHPHPQKVKPTHRAPYPILLGLMLMTIAFGYASNTGAQKWSGHQYDSDVVRVTVPTVFLVCGFAVFVYGILLGDPGRAGKVARFECLQ